MRNLLALLFLAALPALGADFGGSWQGTMKLKAQDGTILQEGSAFLNLKQEGAVVTGQAGTEEDSQAVKNGKADGAKLTFQVQNDDGPIDVTLTLSESGELTGQANGVIEGRKIVAELRFQRGN